MVDKVFIEKDRKIGYLTINRPGARNALDYEAVGLLIAGLQQLQSDDDVNVVVLRSAGEKAFCAGADIKEMSEKSNVPGHEAGRGLIDIFPAIMKHEKPIVCSIQGHALGAGCGLVAAADLAVASDNAIFSVPEINLGFFPLGLIVPLIRTIGRKQANELMFTGKRIGAPEALRIGLINKVVSPDDLQKDTLELAKFLAEKDPSALKLGKKAISTIVDMEFNKSVEYTNALVKVLELQR